MKATSILTSAALLLTAITSRAALPVEPSTTITFPLVPGDNYLAPGLVHAWTDCRTLTAVTPTTLTFSTASWTAGAFASGYYVELGTAGTGEGCWAEITGNTATTLSVTTDFTAVAPVGKEFIIRRHVTIGSFLGVTNTAGLLAGSDLSTADEVMIHHNMTGTVIACFYDGTGWYDENFNPAADVTIPPDRVLIIRRKAGPLSPSFAGRVRQNRICIPLHTSWNLVPQPARPAGAAFGNWTLGTSLLNPASQPLVMAMPNYTGIFTAPAFSFSSNPWAGGGTNTTILTAGRVANVFAMPGYTKWCR